MKNGLKLRDLISIATGTVIGAGVVTLIGPAIGITGYSAWYAYGAAVLIGLTQVAPYIFLCSSIRANGGNYSFVSAIMGDFWGGFYGMSFLLNMFAISLFGLSMGLYLNVLFPTVNVKIAALCVVTFFYITNLFGVKTMAKLQDIMFILLLGGLFCYILFGFLHLDSSIIQENEQSLFTAGFSGFLSAVTLFMFSTTGHCYVISFSKDAKNAKRDIPKAILMTTGIIFVIYVCVGFVTCNTLPLQEVAGQNLAVVARKTMPPVFYYIFILGGPIMALFTTINSNFTIYGTPWLKMIEDGWFPKVLAKRNRYDIPYILYTIIFVIGILPLICGIPLGTIVDNNVFIDSFGELLAFLAIWRFPDAVEGAWDNRYYKYSRVFFKTCMGISIGLRIALIFLAGRDLTNAIIIFTVSVLLIFFVYAKMRYASGRVSVQKSYELQ